MSSTLLELKNIRKLFPLTAEHAKNLKDIFRQKQDFVHAVDGVDLSIGAGEIVALVGESGCGKTTLARTIVGLEKPDDGEIYFENRTVSQRNRSEIKALRRKIQMVFQDPYESLNPTQTVAQLITEALEVHSRELRLKSDRWHELALNALSDAGLKPAQTFINRYPHELSGGQRQRVAIGAAMVLGPQLIVADEPVSMLDVSIRAEILNLLLELRQKRGVSILFISHDLGTVACFAERIAVMYLGRIVELGSTAEVLESPQHPYTRALLSAIPASNPRYRQSRQILEGETPSPVNLPAGCRFQNRCPIGEKRCREVDPMLVPYTLEHYAACILIQS
jgi:oligopeptide/dipeptide ABC transporter ATP-binding protein